MSYFAFIHSKKVVAEHRFEMIHFDFVGRFIIKHKVVVNEFENSIGLCIFEQKE